MLSLGPFFFLLQVLYFRHISICPFKLNRYIYKKKLMKLVISALILMSLNAFTIFGQEKTMERGEVLFHAIEKRTFTANSSEFKSAISFTENTISLAVPINSFKFKNAEMQKEFNQKENFNSTTHPSLLFNGIILSNTSIGEEGRHIVTLKGELTIKGQSHKLETKGLLVNKSGQTSLKASFLIDGKKYGLNSAAYKDFIEQLEFSLEIEY